MCGAGFGWRAVSFLRTCGWLITLEGVKIGRKGIEIKERVSAEEGRAAAGLRAISTHDDRDDEHRVYHGSVSFPSPLICGVLSSGYVDSTGEGVREFQDNTQGASKSRSVSSISPKCPESQVVTAPPFSQRTISGRPVVQLCRSHDGCP